MKINNLYKFNIWCLLILTFLYIIIKMILNACNLEFRKWLNITIIVLLMVLLFSFIVLSLIKLILHIRHTKSRGKRLSILLLIILAILLGINLMKYNLVYMAFDFSEEEYVIETSGAKTVAIVNIFKNINIKYYDYRNCFVRSNTIKSEKNVDVQNIEEVNDILNYLREFK